MGTVTLFILLVTSVWLVAEISSNTGFTVEYKVDHTRKTYAAAAEACTDQGGTLPQPRSPEEYDVMVNALHFQGIGQFWIGLTRGLPEWRWVDGTPLRSTWAGWAEHSPNGTENQKDCVAHRRAGPYDNPGWHNEPCTKWFHSVCEFNNGTYKKKDIFSPWTNAVCTPGTQLAQPKTLDKQRNMVQELDKPPPTPQPQYWIGLRHVWPDWTWQDGTTLSERDWSWGLWAENQLAVWENQTRCVVGDVSDGGVVWKDVRCTESRPYVCRFENECPDGKFGLHCSESCHCRDPCDKHDGRCPVSCENGWQGADCQQECPDGTFGLFCSESCHCQVTCDKHGGGCPSHCDSGWQGADCQQECSDGKFGPDCASDCHCRHPCDKHDGSCPSRCESGWQGVDCQVPTECEDGKVGVECMNSCHCDKAADCDTGSCTTGCQPGWTGSDCQQSACSHKAPCGIHTCQEFGLDFNCSCLRGYENAGPYRCADVNECHHGDACDNHTCVNEEGSYRCVCRDGSYEHIAPQICVKRLTNVERDEVQQFLPEEIALRHVVIAFSTIIIAFSTAVLIGCTFTIVSSVYRFTATEPYRSRRLFVRLSDAFTVVISRLLSDVTDPPV